MDVRELPGNVLRENKKSCILLGCFIALGVVLLASPYGRALFKVLGLLAVMITAATLINHYFWIRMFRPLLQLAGASPVEMENEACCCLCRQQDDSQVRRLRAFFVFVVIVNYAVTLSSVVLDQKLSTTNGKDPHPWIYFSFQWAGRFILLLVSAWFVDVFIIWVRVVQFFRRRLLRGLGGHSDRKEEQFKLPLWAFPSMCLVTWVVLVSVASVQGLKGPVTRTIEVPLANLPTCLDGYSLAVITDIHAGPTVGKAEVERHVEAINALGANAIVMLGDLVDDQVEDIRSIVDPISGFSASDGQFFVLGNHEEHTGEPEKWADFVSDRGFTVLTNERVTLPPGAKAMGNGCYFYLAGVNDFKSNPDYSTALDGRDKSIATVLLAHQPKQVKKAREYSVGLQLSGHTHGGQVFPSQALSYLTQGYVSGLHEKDGTFLYVSEGAVGWGPRMRLLSTREYTLVILRSPELFTEADTSATGPTHAAGAAGALFILTFIYCLGYPMMKAFQQASHNEHSVEFDSSRETEMPARDRVRRVLT